MIRKERFRQFLDYFTQHYPEPKTELNYDSPYQLLVAVILSAQCTDKRINQISPALFERFPDPESLDTASVDEVFSYIRSVSYPNNKAKHLVGMANALIENFGGEIPATLEALQTLPGVGRKTAHVILSVVYNEPTMAVDTHVFRVAHRLGLAPLTATTPLAVEKALMAYIPKIYVPKAHHWLILHGRYVCMARLPKCAECHLQTFCRYYEKSTPLALAKRRTA